MFFVFFLGGGFQSFKKKKSFHVVCLQTPQLFGLHMDSEQYKDTPSKWKQALTPTTEGVSIMATKNFFFFTRPNLTEEPNKIKWRVILSHLPLTAAQYWSPGNGWKHCLQQTRPSTGSSTSKSLLPGDLRSPQGAARLGWVPGGARGARPRSRRVSAREFFPFTLEICTSVKSSDAPLHTVRAVPARLSPLQGQFRLASPNLRH